MKVSFAGKTMKIKQLTIILITVISSFLVVEFLFRHYVAHTTSSPTLVRENWIKKYWLKNSMGYRDFDYSVDELINKKIVLIAGDSITGGVGINDNKNRYTDILQRKIGDQWQIINLGIPGYNMRQKMNAIKIYPYKENVKMIIVQFYFDDFVPVCFKYCGTPPIYAGDWAIPESSLYAIVRKSYFVNYVYWRLYEITFGFRKNLINQMNSYLNHCVKSHKEQICRDTFYYMQEIMDFCKQNKIKLVVLNIPHLEKNEIMTKLINDFWGKMKSMIENNNIPTIDVTAKYTPYKISRLRVNMSDYHPNEKAHKIIAEYLFDELTNMNLISTIEKK